MKNRITAITPEILLISSYPPRECGIATFSQDLRTALQEKFRQSYSVSVCALEAGAENRNDYPAEVRMVLHTSEPQEYLELAQTINADRKIQLVLLQHEFGFFENLPEANFLHFLQQIKKPLVIAFHTVLPEPSFALKIRVKNITEACASVVVMTQNSAFILESQYEVPAGKIQIIAHGVHLVPHLDKAQLKRKYGLSKRKVLSTFGLISSGKSIETTLEALPAIIAANPTTLFLVIGKTHPSVLKQDGEEYRRRLEAKVIELKLENHVTFINAYLPLSELLEYLQLTDLYLFTSKDPHQAVSGTFMYAVSCGCPIISTPIPHACEVLRDDAGILFDFQDAQQLALAVNRLLTNRALRKKLINNGLQRAVFAAWENSAVEYAMLFQKNLSPNSELRYSLPPVKLNHIKKLTTDFGMIQFSKINHPDLKTGYTIDDNARAMVALSMHFERFRDRRDLTLIKIYLDFISHCLQADGSFLNYVDVDKSFTKQNTEVNLEDSNGRAIWALGYLISLKEILPTDLVNRAETILGHSLGSLKTMHSTRAMAFAIKGLYYFLTVATSHKVQALLETLADRIVQMYRHEAEMDWCWVEPYLTYGNSIIPEAMLGAWLSTGNITYKKIAFESFDFLLKHTFTPSEINVVPNNGWMQKGQEKARFGEQPIDVAYTIMALELFYEVFKDESYRKKMEIAFNWFLGQNHLHQIIYNPCTGGCYDGLEETQVNLNQGAESTVSYLMARMVVEKTFHPKYQKYRPVLKQKLLTHSASMPFLEYAAEANILAIVDRLTSMT